MFLRRIGPIFLLITLARIASSQPHHSDARHLRNPYYDRQQLNYEELRESYNRYWQLYQSRTQTDAYDMNGLPWYFHLWPPHFQWPPHFPFWPPFSPPPPPPPPPVPLPLVQPVNFTKSDIDRINLALNIHYLQAEFFLHAAYGHGLDKLQPRLCPHGSKPIVGGRKANLSRKIQHIAKELGLQSAGHIRATRDNIKDRAISRPSIDISSTMWSKLMHKALNRTQQHGNEEFDPYANDVNFLIAAYMIPYIGLNTLVDSSHRVTGTEARKLVAGLVGVQAAQDAVIRTLLFEMLGSNVQPFNQTVTVMTIRISNLRRKLDGSTKTDEGLSVSLTHGAEKMVTGNVISANSYSLSISRAPQQILQVLYGTGNASKPGAFFPGGANGGIAKAFLTMKHI